MLTTLLKIGEWQSQGKSKWDRFLEAPKVEYKDKNGNEIRNYILPIVFDLDEGEVVIDRSNIIEYDDLQVEKLKVLKIQGGNNKAIYSTVPTSKLIQLYKTFFGKENVDTKQGEIVEAIKKEFPEFLTDSFSTLLKSIFLLKSSFLEKTVYTNEKTNKEEISFKKISKQLKFSSNEAVALITIVVRGGQGLLETERYFSEINEYNEFLEHKFFSTESPKKQLKDNTQTRMCYASGKISDNVTNLDLSPRYSLNKMFVEETKNYASFFNKNNFHQNYQVGKENQEKLDFASNYILHQGGLRVKIANIDHVLVPQFLEKSNVDLRMALSGIKKKSDILFAFDTLEDFSISITDEVQDIFWINFIAYESDGNFFKSTQVIKDVSNFHFQKVIDALRDTHWEFKGYQFLNWENVMTEYGKRGRLFNFNSVYSLIPLRKEKEKKNKALVLFKAILENRPVSKRLLFQYFCELMLCHYYERYSSYTNILPSSKEYLSNSIRTGVFKYHAFIQVLKKLNLIDMNDEVNVKTSEIAGKYDQAINDFFEKMQLNQNQQAMFYLGRILNTVEFIQSGKKKTVINKVNFNGMDRDDIQRLRISLMEKAKQYSKVGMVILTDRKFGELFDNNQWELNPQEAVFFLLTGYSFGISKNDAEKLDSQESDDLID